MAATAKTTGTPTKVTLKCPVCLIRFTPTTVKTGTGKIAERRCRKCGQRWALTLRMDPTIPGGIAIIPNRIREYL